MITDIFLKRYPQQWYFQHGVPGELPVLFHQAAQLVFRDLHPYIEDNDLAEICECVCAKIIREVPGSLTMARSFTEMIPQCLTEQYDIYNDHHSTPEYFVKIRLSVIELLFREIGERFASGYRSGSSALLSRIIGRSSQTRLAEDSEEQKAFRNATQELNHRLKEARIPLHYHNGFLQCTNDEVTTSQIAEPFWHLVADQKWKNVDIDIKEAIDRRDTRGRDVALYALKALESTLKIISDEKGWTRGNERGAAHYIDNLVSTANGAFIVNWEADALKALFRDLRNPHGHGPGTSPQPSLTEEQQSWVIECCMSWIKSLVSRM